MNQIACVLVFQWLAFKPTLYLKFCFQESEVEEEQEEDGEAGDDDDPICID